LPSRSKIAFQKTIRRTIILPMGSFEAVVSAFSHKVAELREATLLRVDGKQTQHEHILRLFSLPPATQLTRAVRHPCDAVRLGRRTDWPGFAMQTIPASCTPRTWKQ
jgi:hypothetical protein